MLACLPTYKLAHQRTNSPPITNQAHCTLVNPSDGAGYEQCGYRLGCGAYGRDFQSSASIKRALDVCIRHLIGIQRGISDIPGSKDTVAIGLEIGTTSGGTPG